MYIIKHPVISQQGNEYLVEVEKDYQLYKCQIHSKLSKPKKSLFGKVQEYEKKSCFNIICTEENFFTKYTDFNQFVETCINMYEEEKAFELKLKRAEESFANGSKSIDFRL